MLALTLLLTSPLLAMPALSTDSALPPPLEVLYDIHEVHDDENSPVAWSFTVEILPIGRDGDTVMWNIVAVEFSEAATGRSWRHAGDPKIASWSIKHANPVQPAESEFAALPAISGTAAPDEATVQPLVYSVSGREPTMFMVPRFWWELTYENEQEPQSQGADAAIWVSVSCIPTRSIH